MARSFSALNLTRHDDIADTLSSLASSFFDCRAWLVLLLDDDAGALRIAVREGFAGSDELLSDQGRALWAWFMDEKLATQLGPNELLARWPEAPPALRQGMACVAIDLQERSIGLLVVAGNRSGAPFDDEGLTFLSSASGLGAMAIANANTHVQQLVQQQLAELRAEQAAAQTREKQAALTQLDDRLAIIEAQQQQITELSTPILQLRAEVLVLPLIGVMNAQRAEHLMDRLLDEIARRQVSYVILDITGIDTVDTHTADYLIRLARAARLLGVVCVLTGIRAAVAQTLVGLGADLSAILTKATLGAGLDECDRRLGRRR